MLIRIVKMSFDPEKVTEFQSIFNDSKEKIRSQPGCHHLELLRDIDQPNIFLTYSYWEGPEYLEQYRNSALFGTVWKSTKALFNDQPQAWSVNREWKSDVS